MKAQEIISLIFGTVLFTMGTYVMVYEPAWVSSIYGAAAGLIGAGIALVAITLWNYMNRKSGIIKEDERDYRIAEKASFRTFQIIFIIQGFLLAVLGIINIQLPAQPVVATLFAITGISYMGFFQWYRKQM
ncbi:DUF2178 domain-containing protein [Methanolobus bombayensis]|uniref:DUF2178 domain-containing protein n=1 Tax=Methanolobus bombayensis TaxID=38023 RepID=UPI001AE59C48|nr:DUF2178 domain-containing protein [Methanolobus bombayensis]